jgi:hypothetical protein
MSNSYKLNMTYNVAKKIYSLNGGKHRPNGPAVGGEHEYFIWYLYGEPHRYYGPANQLKNWFIHGRVMYKESHD